MWTLLTYLWLTLIYKKIMTLRPNIAFNDPFLLLKYKQLRSRNTESLSLYDVHGYVLCYTSHLR